VHQEVPKEDAAVEIGSEHCHKQKDMSWKKFAAAGRKMTHHTGVHSTRYISSGRIRLETRPDEELQKDRLLGGCVS
jgi:hypothetical protein